MKNMKGQAALDFLMTYGWAIALVVIIAAVLFALGVFDVGNFVGNRASGFSGVAVSGWQMDPSGNFKMQLSNQVGQRITVDNVTVNVGLENRTMNGLPATLNTGQSTGMLNSTTNFTGSTTGSGYTAKVVIRYTDQSSGFPYTTSGTLTGRVA